MLNILNEVVGIWKLYFIYLYVNIEFFSEIEVIVEEFGVNGFCLVG